MDVFYLVLTIAFIALTGAIVPVFERLRRG